MAINLKAALTRRILSYRPTYLPDDIVYVVRAVSFQLYVYQAHTRMPIDGSLSHGNTSHH